MGGLKKITSIFLSLLVTVSLPVFADIPEGTVVLQNKAYDLNYFNNESNSEKIHKEIMNLSPDIYVKGYDGKWYDDASGNIISKDKIPSVTYRGINGKLCDYAARDGEKVVLNVAEASYISSNEVMVRFNKKVDKNTALDRANYKINDNNLSEKDAVKLMKDGKTVIITLNQNLEGKKNSSSIFVSKNILDVNKNLMNSDYLDNVIVVNDTKSVLDKQIDCDVDIIADNYVLKDTNINGNIYVNADSVRVLNSDVSKNIIVNPGDSGKTNISSVSAKGIVVLSGGTNSIHLYNVKADLLNVDSCNNVRVELKGKSEITKTIVKSDAILDNVWGSFGDVTVSIEENANDTNNGNSGQAVKTVELRGTFKKPIILESNVILKTAKNAHISNVVVMPQDKNANIVFYGKFDKVSINNEANIKVKKGSYIGKIDSNININVDVEKGAIVKETSKNITNTGNGEIGNNSENTSVNVDNGYNGGGNSGGNSGGDHHSYQEAPIAKNVTILGDFIVGQTLTGNYVYYDKNGDKEGSSIFKWYRADDNNGTNKVKIDGAISKTYKLTSEDEGKYISFEVTPVAKTGTRQGNAVLSSFVGPIKEEADTVKPVITLIGAKTIELTVGETFNDPGATAVDNVDGDITSRINTRIIDESGNKVSKVNTSKQGAFIIHYNVSDTAGNEADEVTRTVIVRQQEEADTVKPVITLIGAKTIELTVGETFNDSGATAVDNVDGDITSRIIATIFDKDGNEVSKVDTSKSGVFIIHYNVSDTAGNEADEVTRTVIVNDSTAKQSVNIQVQENKVTISIESPDIKDIVRLRIKDEKGNEVYFGDKSKSKGEIVNNICEFNFTIYKNGKYTVYLDALKNADIIVRTFTIDGTDSEKPVSIQVQGNKVKILVESADINDSVRLRITNEKGYEVYFAEKRRSNGGISDNKCEFSFAIYKNGEYTAYLNAVNNEDEIIKTFVVNGN